MLVRNRPLIALYTIAGLAAKTIAGTTSVNAPNYPLTVTDAVNLALRQNPTILNHVNGWQSGVTGQWNILDGGTTYGNVKVANSQIEEAKIALNDAERQVEMDVFTAVSNLHRAQENMIAAQKGVEVSLHSFSEAHEGRTEGKGSQLDVFDARNQLTTARSTFLRSEYQYLAAVAQYQYATGTETTYNDEFDHEGVHPKTFTKLSHQ